MNQAINAKQLLRQAFSPSEFAKKTGLGRTTVYEELNSGRLRSFKVGARRLISSDAIAQWIADREAERESS